MSISDDLMLAILAMDSYNRGYGERIDGLGGLGSEIGNATLITDSEATAETSSSARDLSFYAAAYAYDGETIISNRGTDDSGLSADLSTGWL